MPNTIRKVPINSLTFDWQRAPEQTNRQHIEAIDEWIDYPLPDHMGKGRLRIRNLLTGMQVVRCEIDFNPAMAGIIEQVKETSIAFAEPTLECHSLMSGRIYIEEKGSLNQYMYDTSVDFFRYSRGFEFSSRYDCSHGICATAVMVGESVLFDLIGAEESHTLLEQLDLLPQPKAAMRSIPLAAKKTLHDAFAGDIPDSMQSIYSQAKSLEYLVLLKEFLASNATPRVAAAKTAILRDLHDQLLGSGENPPSLVDLARSYGMSAKSLNDLFRQEYRTSIFDFILNQRMNSAYDAVVKTDEPLKQLSRRLGYRHVTNFNTAFKRHFGRTPGSLRK